MATTPATGLIPSLTTSAVTPGTSTSTPSAGVVSAVPTTATSGTVSSPTPPSNPDATATATTPSLPAAPSAPVDTTGTADTTVLNPNKNLPAEEKVRDLTKSETVAGNLNDLLNQDSAYMQSARNSALGQANSRGLINSSIAIGAGQTAAINAALPIAQQDASAASASGLSAQNANQSNQTAGFQGYINSSLAEQNNDSAASLKQMEVDQSNKAAFTSAVSPIMQQTQDAIQKIQALPDSVMDADTKTKRINEITAQMQSDVYSVGKSTGQDVTFDNAGQALVDASKTVATLAGNNADLAKQVSDLKSQLDTLNVGYPAPDNSNPA